MTDSAVCHEMIRDDQGVEGGGQCVCVCTITYAFAPCCPARASASSYIRITTYPSHHVTTHASESSCIRDIMYSSHHISET